MKINKIPRKYLAAGLAATSVIAAPAVASAAEIDDFSDVNVGDAHYQSIKSLTEQGVISGHTETSYGVNDDLERVHSAIMFARALDLDIPDDIEDVLETYDDVDSGYQYSEEVAAVTEAGIFRGSSGVFNPEGGLTREQMATTIVKAFGLNDDGSDPGINLANVSPSHRDGVKILAQYGITNQLDDFRPRETVSRGQFATFVYKTQQLIEDEKPKEPSFEKITADNLKQIEMTLSGNVDLEAAANTDNYELEDEDGDELDFTVDVQNQEAVQTASASTKVLLTIDDADIPDNQDVISITIDEKVTGEEMEQEIEFFDSSVPEITETEVIGSGTIKVSFSEPLAVKEKDGQWVTIDGEESIEDAFDIEQDGSDLFVKSVSLVKNNTEANIELYSSFDEGSVQLAVNNSLEDYSGLRIDGDTFELNVNPDTLLDGDGDELDLVEGALYNSSEDYWTLVVTYPEPMATVGKYAVNNLDNYQMDNRILSDLENVSIDVTNNNTRVELKIAKEQTGSFSIQDNDDLTISRVADATGNPTNDYSFQVTIDDRNFVVISRVEATAVDTLDH